MSNSDFWGTGNSDVIPLLQQMLCMEPNNEADITLLKPNNVRVITTLLNYNVKFIILWSYSITAIKLAAKRIVSKPKLMKLYCVIPEPTRFPRCVADNFRRCFLNKLSRNEKSPSHITTAIIYWMIMPWTSCYICPHRWTWMARCFAHLVWHRIASDMSRDLSWLPGLEHSMELTIRDVSYN